MTTELPAVPCKLKVVMQKMLSKSKIQETNKNSARCLQSIKSLECTPQKAQQSCGIIVHCKTSFLYEL